MNTVIILAGGVGRRFGADRPKQFIKIFEKPILVYTIEIYQNHPEIDAIEKEFELKPTLDRLLK